VLARFSLVSKFCATCSAR